MGKWVLTLSRSHTPSALPVKKKIRLVALLKFFAQRKNKESGEKDAHCRACEAPRRPRGADAQIARRAFRVG